LPNKEGSPLERTERTRGDPLGRPHPLRQGLVVTSATEEHRGDAARAQHLDDPGEEQHRSEGDARRRQVERRTVGRHRGDSRRRVDTGVEHRLARLLRLVGLGRLVGLLRLGAVGRSRDRRKVGVGSVQEHLRASRQCRQVDRRGLAADEDHREVPDVAVGEDDHDLVPDLGVGCRVVENRRAAVAREGQGPLRRDDHGHLARLAGVGESERAVVALRKGVALGRGVLDDSLVGAVGLLDPLAGVHQDDAHGLVSQLHQVGGVAERRHLGSHRSDHHRRDLTGLAGLHQGEDLGLGGAVGPLERSLGGALQRGGTDLAVRALRPVDLVGVGRKQSIPRCVEGHTLGVAGIGLGLGGHRNLSCTRTLARLAGVGGEREGQRRDGTVGPRGGGGVLQRCGADGARGVLGPVDLVRVGRELILPRHVVGDTRGVAWVDGGRSLRLVHLGDGRGALGVVVVHQHRERLAVLRNRPTGEVRTREGKPLLGGEDDRQHVATVELGPRAHLGGVLRGLGGSGGVVRQRVIGHVAHLGDVPDGLDVHLGDGHLARLAGVGGEREGQRRDGTVGPRGGGGVLQRCGADGARGVLGPVDLVRVGRELILPRHVVGDTRGVAWVDGGRSLRLVHLGDGRRVELGALRRGVLRPRLLRADARGGVEEEAVLVVRVVVLRHVDLPAGVGPDLLTEHVERPVLGGRALRGRCSRLLRRSGVGGDLVLDGRVGSRLLRLVLLDRLLSSRVRGGLGARLGRVGGGGARGRSRGVIRVGDTPTHAHEGGDREDRERLCEPRRDATHRRLPSVVG